MNKRVSTLIEDIEKRFEELNLDLKAKVGLLNDLTNERNQLVQEADKLKEEMIQLKHEMTSLTSELIHIKEENVELIGKLSNQKDTPSKEVEIDLLVKEIDQCISQIRKGVL